MLTPTAFAVRTLDHDLLCEVTANDTRIGSSESDPKFWHAKPTGPSSVVALMTTTPVT
jgi:hypothetical protein